MVPEGPEPAAIEVMSGSGQQGIVGEALPDSIVVRVKDSSGRPLSGHSVTFRVVTGTSGAGVDPATAATDAAGLAAVRGQLGTLLGSWEMEASVGSGVTVRVSAAAVAAVPDSMFVVRGQDQSGQVGEVLGDSLVAQVSDRFGNPAAGAEVTWQAAGGGTVSAGLVTTGADGRAAVQRRLGPTAGPQVTTAVLEGVRGSPLSFNHIAAPVVLLSMITQPSSSATSWAPFSRQPVVEVRDDEGNLLDGIQIDASIESGGGTLLGTTRRTSSAGIASFTDLAIGGTDGTRTLRFSAQYASVVSAAVSVNQSSETIAGRWSGVQSWPVVAVHLHLLPDGRVLAWGRSNDPQIWDPATNGFTPVPSSVWLFCAGHALLPDGRMLVTGGHIADGLGLADVSIFDFQSGTWSRGPAMQWGRWYPTSTTLPNGEVLTLAGSDSAGIDVETPEVWMVGGGWRKLTGAVEKFPLYPMMFVAPDGRVFYAGPERRSRYLNTSGIGSWSGTVATTNAHARSHASAVMYEPGKILITGGSDSALWNPTNSAEVIDLNRSPLTWRLVGSMQHARIEHNATILPTGEVLVTGGTSIGPNDAAGAVHAAEVWSPQTESWTTLASSGVNRMYHSTSILLPDGRVLHAGSGEGKNAPDEFSAELFSPPYLFKGPRPVITSAPATVGYDQSFVVLTPDAASIAQVTLVRLGSATHAFDQNQRANRLNFSKMGTGVSVWTPANGNLAPPGHYMLFLINADGVPSVARIIRIG